MSETVFRTESAVEFFKGLVDEALARQHIVAGELTAFYVVHLLAGFLRPPADQEKPLVVRLAQALEAGGSEQRDSLRRIGDFSLFVAGFFSDSFRRRLIDIDYYVSIGGRAYGTLSRYDTDTFASVFAELAEKFVDFVDVLADVSERTSCASNLDLMRLYERWLKTGSSHCGQLLVQRGVVPNASIKTIRVH